MGNRALPWFVKRDIDGFFGLMIDNLIQLMLIVVLCKQYCGMSSGLIFEIILPGAAASILVGNLFYAIQARRLAQRTLRDDVTALPYGINTPSLLAYIFLIMAPVYQETGSSEIAWKVGMAACFLSGVIETLGAFVGDWMRRLTTRAALLSTLAGIAITFISMDFVFKMYSEPLIALVPMVVILVAYMSRIRLPLGLPGGLTAVAIGAGTAWLLHAIGERPFVGQTEGVAMGFYLPTLVVGDAFSFISSDYVWRYISVIVPMGLFNVIGSLQNLESAEAAGDRYETFPSLAVNGIGSIVASFFGSCFPTTIYIGHPGWKALGARWGYSILNGAFITIVCFSGAVMCVLNFIPIEAGVGILLWIGIIIVSQAFQETPRHHAPAVAIGLIPALAAWGLMLIESGLSAGGTTLGKALAAGAFAGGAMTINGVIALSQGFIFTSMILSAMAVHIIERQFSKAAVWSIIAALLSFLGIIHAFRVSDVGIVNDVRINASPHFTIAYVAVAAMLFLLYLRQKAD